ncbi:MAG TPA: helicase HerA-like domain-containing protein, partial [Nocardioides sp.]
DQITNTVRLIRSKGVGVFFVTQKPTDVPDDVLGQLGSRIQHQLRVATPNDAKALKASVNTYPTSSYDDLGAVIQTLGIGEAIVTVMNERGAPTPVAWTRLRAPESLMGPADAAAMEAAVAASPLAAKYTASVEVESAVDQLKAKTDAAEAARAAEAEEKAAKKTAPTKSSGSRSRSRDEDDSMIETVVKSTAFKQAARTAARELVRGIFKRR